MKYLMQKSKMRKILPDGEFYNRDTASCESNIKCPEGQRLNYNNKLCEDIPDNGQDPFEEDHYKPPDKCIGGEILEDYGCMCPEDKILFEGVCIDENLYKKKNNCKNGFKVNGKCVCIGGLKLTI